MASAKKNTSLVIDETLNPLNAKQLMDNLVVDVLNGQPACVHGQPGSGKSSIVHQLAARLEKTTGKPWRMWDDTRLSQIDAVDVHGAPWPDREKGVTQFLRSGIWPDPDSTENIVLFFDEIGQGSMSVQAAIMQLILERRIGAYRLPPGARIVAATNLATDRAGVTKLLGPLANRFVHYQLVPDADPWLEWAKNATVEIAGKREPMIRFELTAFLRYRKDMFYSYEKDRLINTTARSWEYLSRAMYECERMGRKDLWPDKIRACLDAGTAQAIRGFVESIDKFFNELSWDNIVKNPAQAMVPSNDASLTYLLCGVIANKIAPDTADQVFKYINRLPPEFQAICVVDMKIQHGQPIANTAAFQRWCRDNPHAEIEV